MRYNEFWCERDDGECKKLLVSAECDTPAEDFLVYPDRWTVKKQGTYDIFPDPMCEAFESCD